MTDRERLIELLGDFWGVDPAYFDVDAPALADHLLTNGVIILPCKVGDILYITEPRFYNYTKHEGVQRGDCVSYSLDEQWGWTVWVNLDEGEPHTKYAYKFSDFGKTVFLTREEAEAALKGVE